jgi:hypothetical protein
MTSKVSDMATKNTASGEHAGDLVEAHGLPGQSSRATERRSP